MQLPIDTLVTFGEKIIDLLDKFLVAVDVLMTIISGFGLFKAPLGVVMLVGLAISYGVTMLVYKAFADRKDGQPQTAAQVAVQRLVAFILMPVAGVANFLVLDPMPDVIDVPGSIVIFILMLFQYFRNREIDDELKERAKLVLLQGLAQNTTVRNE